MRLGKRMKEQDRTYGIVPRSDELGSGWKLSLFEGGQEVGGGVFPVPEECPEAGINWWNSIPIEERSFWMVKAASAVPADARHAYLQEVAYDDAVSTGQDWTGEA